jgi:glycosyltransferase involved in cell wall biosynthesis
MPTLKVSVVVAVHNTGEAIQTCVQSLLAQSMPAADYEAVFVDDGSTDGTGELLDELVARHPQLKVLHTQGSGGPGRPRNLGIDLARGEYIYFLDHDDRLAPEALERLYAMATRNDADIVIGKLVGHGRAIPVPLFRESRDQADILDDHLLTLLTPHKLFRAELLSGLRFPEGKAWLEDHRFVVPAYFRAKVISVLADYACCHWVKRETGRNLSARPFRPHDYYQALREVLDVVDAHAGPGTERDRLYASWYARKMLRVLDLGRLVFGLPLRPVQYHTYREVRRLCLERVPASVDEWLPPRLRQRSRALRSGGWPALLRSLRAEQGLGCEPSLDRVAWEGDELVVSVSGRLSYPYDDSSGLPADDRIDLYARNRDDHADFPLPSESSIQVTAGQAEFTCTARIDPRTAKLGSPLERGTWDLFVRSFWRGEQATRRLGPGALDRTQPPAARRRDAKPYWTGAGNLSIRIG